MSKDKDFWVIGVGASAGGLEALSIFFKSLPENPNAAFIVAQHLAPHAKSMMVELLGRHTTLSIEAAKDHLPIKKGLICIVPPNYDVTTIDGEMRLTKAGNETRPKPSVDTFFSSLAHIYGRRAVGIILSGTGSDGSEGIRAIKEHGGVALVQDSQSAKYDGMPKSAFETGLVDAVLPPEEMAQELFEILAARQNGPSQPMPAEDSREYTKIIAHLKKEIGTDFSQYKSSTIQRRIEKRLSALQIKDLKDYYSYLTKHSTEVMTLSQNMLVSVTSFFRDTEAFSAIQKCLEEIISKKVSGDELRVWSAGCATGEEPYSLAFLITDICEKQGKNLALKIFATDLDQEALTYARTGIYSAEEVRGMDQHYLQKYFDERNQYFEVRKSIRESIVFARQDLVQNPPFVKLDLVTCRNVLIYFETSLQSRIFQIFHYALKPSGTLFLGKSESVDPSLFEVVDRKEKIFRRMNVVQNMSHVSSGRYATGGQAIGFHAGTKKKFAQGLSLAELAPLQILKMLDICAMVVDEDGIIQHLMGDVSQFVAFPTGQADFRLQNLLPKNATVEFSVLLKKASKENKVFHGRTFQQESGEKKSYAFSLKPLEGAGSAKPLFLVSFEFKKPLVETAEYTPLTDDAQYPERLRELEQEVAATKENLQTLIEELEISNEELQSLNEELSSTNEELQASNEELETTNEELQSTNEELMTLNEELNIKSSELKLAYASLDNIQSSIAAPMLVLDRDLKLIRYNSSTGLIFSLTPADLQQPINKASCHCEIPGFEQNIRHTIRTGEVREVLCDTGKHIFQMRIHPNRDENKEIIGAIIIFFDNTEFIKTQDKLKNSDKRIRAIIDSSPTLISLKDNLGRYLVVNHAFCRFYDLKEEEVIGKSDREIFSEEHANDLRDNDLEVLLKRNSTERQERIQLKGKQHVFLSNRFPLFGVNETSPYAVGVVSLDVTEQVSAQEELKHSEARYRAIIEDQAVFVCRHLPDGVFTFTNNVFCGSFGGTPEGNLSRNFYSIVNKVDVKKVQNELSKITSLHPIIQYEHRTVGVGTSAPRWIRWIHRGIFNDSGELVEYQAVGFDVTEVHNQTAELLAKESLYSHVLEHTSDYLSVYRFENDGFYLEMFNQSAATHRLGGQPRLLGRSLRDLVSAHSVNEMERKFKKSLDTRTLMNFEEEIEGPGGAIFLSTNIVPIHDQEEGHKRVVAISRDITKLKRVEKALREEMHNAEAANTAKSDFLASMSHELRTPLNVIMGMGQLLGRGDLQPQQLKLVESIQRSSRVLLALIEDVLDLSKIEAGKVSFDMKPMSVDQLISDSVEAFETEAQGKKLELKKSLSIPQDLMVLGDEVRLKQILNNLIGNAIKFTHQGSVHVSGKVERFEDDSATLYFEVRDTGVGIPAESHHKIFKRFSQADSGISRQFGGTGLGLAISKQLVELMSGDIGFRSEAGEGSTFWFRLSLPVSSGEQTMNTAEASPLDLSALKVLAVDDNPESLRMLKLMFDDHGGNVEVVESGEAALKAVSRETFDLILMDMQMPGMDGLEATRRIRALPNHKRRTPVIALTANAMAGDKERCLNSGMNDYLTKPLSFDELLKVMKRWV